MAESTIEKIEVYGIAAQARTQTPLFEAHCIGDCGKISMAGAIDDPIISALLVYCEPRCPYGDVLIPNYGETMSFGKPHIVHLRMLRTVKQETPT